MSNGLSEAFLYISYYFNLELHLCNDDRAIPKRIQIMLMPFNAIYRRNEELRLEKWMGKCIVSRCALCNDTVFGCLICVYAAVCSSSASLYLFFFPVVNSVVVFS